MSIRTYCTYNYSKRNWKKQQKNMAFNSKYNTLCSLHTHTHIDRDVKNRHRSFILMSLLKLLSLNIDIEKKLANIYIWRRQSSEQIENNNALHLLSKLFRTITQK